MSVEDFRKVLDEYGIYTSSYKDFMVGSQVKFRDFLSFYLGRKVVAEDLLSSP